MQNRYKNINHSVNNILFGTKRYKLTKSQYQRVKRNPYLDFDRDGVLNAYDCNPYNPNQQGFFSGAKQSVKNISASIKGLFTKKSGADVLREEKEKKISETKTGSTEQKVLVPSGTSGAKIVTVSEAKNIPKVPSSGLYTGSLPKSSSGSSSKKESQSIGVNVISTEPTTFGETKTTSQTKQFENLQPVSRPPRKLSFVSNVIKKASEGSLITIPISKLSPDYTTPPSTVPPSQQLGYQKRSTPYEIIPTTADLRRLGYEEEALKQDVGFRVLTTQLGLDRIANNKAKEIGDQLASKYQTKLDEEISKSPNRSEEQIDKITAKWNKLYNEEINNKVNKEMVDIIKSETDILGKDVDKLAKESMKRIDKRNAPYVFVSGAITGAGIGLISTLSPVAGVAVAGGGIASLIAGGTAVSESARENPYSFFAGFAGGIIGGFGGNLIANNIKNVNNKIKLERIANKYKLSPENIEKTYSFSTSKGVKIGLDAEGNTLYRVTQKGKVNFINKKTGKIIETADTYSDVTVKAKSGTEAQTTITKGSSLFLKKSGYSFNKNGNVLTVKGDVSVTAGQYTSSQVGKGIFKGSGKALSSSGDFIVELPLKDTSPTSKVITDLNVKSARISGFPNYKTNTDFVSKLLGRYREVKRVGDLKITGRESMFESVSVSDTTKIYTSKGKRILNAKPVRDISADYSKFFVPKGLKIDTTKIDFNPSGTGTILVTPRPSSQVVRTATEAQIRADVVALAEKNTRSVTNAFNKNVFSSIKTVNVPEVKVSPVVLPSLIESNYPTYVGGTKVRTTNFLTGGVIFDSDVTTRPKSKSPSITSFKYSTNISDLILTPSVTKVKTTTRTETDNRTKTDNRFRFNFNSLISPSITNQATDNQFRFNYNSLISPSVLQPTSFKQPSITKISQPASSKQKSLTKVRTAQLSIPAFNTPRFNFNYDPFKINFKPIFPKLPKLPKGTTSKGRKGKSKKGKSRTTRYTSSVSAFQLGLTAPKGYRTKGKFTGLEIRPILYNKKETFDNEYRKRLNKITNFF